MLNRNKLRTSIKGKLMSKLTQRCNVKPSEVTVSMGIIIDELIENIVDLQMKVQALELKSRKY